MVDRPFLSMTLSAADPEPASSSFSDLSENVKMVLPFHRFTIGLFSWDVSLQIVLQDVSFSASGCISHLGCAFPADIVRVSWTFLGSS